MKRPLVLVAVSVLWAVLGAVAGIRWCIFLYLSALICIIFIQYSKEHKNKCGIKALKYYIAYFMFCVIVFQSTILYATSKVSQSQLQFPVHIINNNTGISGVIQQISGKEYGSVLILSCNNRLVKVTLYNNDNSLSGDLEVGDYVHVQGEVGPIAGPRNDGEFDSATYYGSLGVFHQIESNNCQIIEKVTGVQKAINALKSRLERIYEMSADAKEAGVLKAVILGDKSDLDKDMYELYQNNGIAHILAISGLHISFIGMMVYKLFRRVISGYIFPFGASMLVMLLYVVMTGNSVSAKRAVIMCIVSMGADVLGRTYDVLSALSLAAILIVLENVFIIYNSGFLLSFGAILGIAVVYPAFDKLFIRPLAVKSDRLDRKRQVAKRQFMKAVVAVLSNLFGSISVSIVTLPIIMYHYYQVPVYSIFLNIVVIPLMSMLLLCALLVGGIGLIALPVATFFMGAVHYIIKLYTMLCHMFDELPGNMWVTGRTALSDCIVYYILLAVFVILVWKSKCKEDMERTGAEEPIKLTNWANRLYIGVVVIALIIVIPRNYSNLAIRVLDVGQGDCIYVQYKGENYLFDGGSTDITNVGVYRIYPCLRANGVAVLDYVFVSHGDTDHISGIIELINMESNAITIKNLVLPGIKNTQEHPKYIELVKLAHNRGINVMYVNAGATYTAFHKGLTIECLHPEVSYNYVSSNDYSAVYKLNYREFSMLLTGDVENAGEQAIVDNYSKVKPGGLCSTVLKVAHHGSKNSSSEIFLHNVKPKYGVISCGVDNIYGHPAKETLERLNACGAKVYITAQCGQITIEVDKGVRIYGYLDS